MLVFENAVKGLGLVFSWSYNRLHYGYIRGFTGGILGVILGLYSLVSEVCFSG